MHVLLGGAVIAAAYCIVDVPAHSTAMILGSIVYVSWFARRVAGFAVASVAGSVEIFNHVQPSELFVRGVLCTLGYLMVAWCVSAVEAATRPQ